MAGKLDGIYFRSPIWLQNALVSAYGYRLRVLRYGSKQQEYLDGLLQSQWWSPEELRQLQEKRFDELLAHAQDTVPLYQEHLSGVNARGLATLGNLPLLRKEDLRAPRDRVVSRAFHNNRLEEIHTGGTTGTPLTIYCDRAALQLNYAFFGRLRHWAGIGSHDRVATFAGRTIVPPGSQQPPFWRWNRAANTLLFSSYHISPSTLPHYVNALVKFQPALIDSYPSSIEPIARYVLENGIADLRPRAVITSSETLEASVRELVERAFGCKVFDHYGAAEMAALVTQCEEGSYHANPEFGVLELLRDGEPVGVGEYGEIVATGFVNRAMPIIRYATGDLAMWREGACQCGRSFPMLEHIEGRRDDVIITPEGRRIGRLDPIFKAVSSIFEAQVVQVSPDLVRIYVVGSEFSESERVELDRELRKRIGLAMRIEIISTERIPRTRSGKFRSVVNLVASAGQERVLHE